MILGPWLKPLFTVIMGLVISALIAQVTGYPAWTVLSALWAGSVGNLSNLASTLVIFVPLSLMGLGIAIAFRAGLFNIGAEGQYWMGAIAAAWVGAMGGRWLPGLHLVVLIMAAVVAGGLYALIPGLLKAYRGAHEVITTMMLSYAAIEFGHYLIEKGPLMLPGSIPESPPIEASATLPILVPTTELSEALFFALAGIIVAAWLLFRTRMGFEIQMTGKNSKAARLAGVSVPRLTVISMMLSGMFAGLAGGLQISGVSHQLFDSFANQYGYTAIVVALLARNNPWGIIPSAFLFAALQSGAGYMQMNAYIPAQIAYVIQGTIVLMVAIDRLFDGLGQKMGWFRKNDNPPADPFPSITHAVVEEEGTL
ncbi:MAG: ABC transporter permease [Sulfobacillus thermosulfidooxidans]|nr:MAG: ABC transporter permease [Sulfobacillus thermosulfidooxidans]